VIDLKMHGENMKLMVRSTAN